MANYMLIMFIFFVMIILLKNFILTFLILNVMTNEQFKFIESVTNHWFIRQLFGKNVLDFIACQFALESNYGTSSLASSYHNFCGMKVPFLRLHYGCGRVGQFQIYKDFDSCVFDYCAWFFYTRPHKNAAFDLNAFKIHLKNVGYCPERDYIDRINLIYQQLKNYKNEE